MKSSLLFAAALFAVCTGCTGSAYPEKPDLPSSISPGWALKNYAAASPPQGLPEGAQPKCWKADYNGAAQAEAEVWVCGYQQGSSAFNAMQRAQTGANTVKFQKGNFLVVVRWNGASRTDLVALMRVLQGTLK